VPAGQELGFTVKDHDLVFKERIALGVGRITQRHLKHLIGQKGV
jgi:hypothetical protein